MRKCFYGVATVLMFGCVGAGGGANNGSAANLGDSLIAPMLEGACHDYVNQQEIWQVAKLALADQAGQIEQQVCQCASQAATQNMTTEQKIALLSPQSRTQVLMDMIAPVAMSCYQRVAGQF